MAICFYRPEDPHGHYSNFSRHPIDLDGRTWMTVEHYFQAMKFWPHAPGNFDHVARAETPGRAAHLGRNLSPIRKDWDSYPRPEAWAQIPFEAPIHVADDVVRDQSPGPLFFRTKDVFMYLALRAKFTQHEDLREALVATRDQFLLERTDKDPYWGDGASREGHNKLGRLLALLRDTELI